MKTIRFTQLAAFLLAIFLMGSCSGWKKMVERANEIGYTVTPSPLEMHGEKVSFSISVTFPTEYFDKKSVVTGTPVIKYGDQEMQLEPMSFAGESVTENYTNVVSFDNGGNFSYQSDFDYEDAMRFSTVELRLSGERNGRTFELTADQDKMLAQGIVTTPRLVREGMAVDNGAGYADGSAWGQTMMAEATLPPLADETYRSVIYYDIHQSSIKASEKSKAEFKTFIEAIQKAAADGRAFKGFEIYSAASPDGEASMNQGLAENRGKAAMEFFKEQLKALGVAGWDNASLQKSTTPGGSGEDWVEFKRLLQSSNVRDKELVLRVVDTPGKSDEQKEQEIKDLASVYTELRNEVLPAIRRSEMRITFAPKGLTDEQILNFAQNDPSKLDATQMIYAASLTDDRAKKRKIYENFSQRFPNDWRGPNNLGVLELYDGDLDGAKSYFEKALALDESAAVLNNLGVVSLAKWDAETAEDYFTRAAEKESTDAIKYNLGVISIMKGKYSEAVQYFAAEQCGFNPALASLLNGDATQALKKLDCVENKDAAYVYYLRAVIGARQNNGDLVFTNLRTAISKDSALKNYAKQDMEFLKYFEDQVFKTIIQ